VIGPSYLGGAIPYPEEATNDYTQRRWWENLTVSGDFLDRMSTTYPDKPAVIDENGSVTYAELKDKADHFAIALLRLGVRSNDRIIVQMPNRYESLVACFGVEKAGAIPVMAVPRHSEREITHFINLTMAVGWIVPVRDKNIEFASLINKVGSSAKTLKYLIMLENGEALHPNALSLEKLINGVNSADYPEGYLDTFRHDPNNVFIILHTSGSTGVPRLVPRTYNSFVCLIRNIAKHVPNTHNDIGLLATPFGHTAGLPSLVYMTIVYGSTLVMINTFSPREILENIEKYKVSRTILVPTQLIDIFNYPGLFKYDLGSLKRIITTASALPPHILHRAKEFFGKDVFGGDVFGMTEGVTIPLRPTDPLEAAKPAIRTPGSYYKVVNDNEEELPPNTEGALVYKGPDLFTGYYQGGKENKEIFTQDGYFKVGDVGKIDDRGYVTITGRTKDTIKRGGETITPGDIENMLNLHSSISAVAVVAMPDPRLREKACAYVELKPGKTLTFDEMISFLKSQGASVLLLPERLEIIIKLPLTWKGKIDKAELRKDIKQKLIEEGSWKE
jgi:non-ribosomal peptide synthetase component E (peptide arylation enzyme)